MGTTYTHGIIFIVEICCSYGHCLLYQPYDIYSSYLSYVSYHSILIFLQQKPNPIYADLAVTKRKKRPIPPAPEDNIVVYSELMGKEQADIIRQQLEQKPPPYDDVQISNIPDIQFSQDKIEKGSTQKDIHKPEPGQLPGSTSSKLEILCLLP